METTLSDSSCPRCKLRLHAASVGPITLQGCGGCGGLWLDNESTRVVIAQVNPEVTSLARMAASNAQKSPDLRQPITCPICSRLLRRVPGGDPSVQVDICDEHGTWFDRGELAQIADLARAHRRSHTAAGAAAAVGSLGLVGVAVAQHPSTAAGLQAASSALAEGASAGSGLIDAVAEVSIEVCAELVFEGVCALVAGIFEV